MTARASSAVGARVTRAVAVAVVVSAGLCGGARAGPAAAGAGGASARSRPVSRFAIVIGNNQPERADTPTLRYADDDAAATHRLLLEAGVHSVLLARLDDDTRRFLTGVAPAGPPRGAAFDAVVERTFAEMRAEASRGHDVELLFFYSGHGDVAHGEGYVLLEDRRVMRRDLFALLSRSPAVRNHVFVDACKSYFMAFERGAGGQRVSYAGALVAAAEPGRLDNVGFVLSTSSDRDSHEWERFQGGILSHELRSALRGAADADHDGAVTYAELGAFVTVANRAIDNPRFRPDVLVRAPAHDLRQVVLRWPEPTSAIRIDGGAFGHLYVENPRGERVLDAHAPAGQPIAIHLPPERPMFVRQHDGGAEVVIADRAPIAVATLERGAREVVARGALQLAFERFFAVPFGARDVEAFERDQTDLMLRARASRDGAGGEDGRAEDDDPGHGRAGGGRARVALLATGGVALTAGLALSGVALQRSLADAGSQAEIADANRTIRRANLASLVCYGVAAATAGVWAWLRARD